MKVTIQVDGLQDALRQIHLTPARAMQGVCNGINRTQEEAMIAGKAVILRAFTDRTPMFLKSIPTGQDRAPIPRDWRATPVSPNALVAIGDGITGQDQGTRRRNILEPFEDGAVKKAHTLPVFIPTKALRPNMSDVIPRALLPIYLLGKYGSSGSVGGLQGLNRGKGKHTKLGARAKSLYSYFVVSGASNPKANGIYERLGPGRTQLIWAARQQVKRPPILQWNTTVVSVVNQQLQANVAGMVQASVAKYGSS
jgi:hypothetical protein